MSVTRFLEDLSARGIRIAPNGEKLSVSGPDGALTDTVKDSIRTHRAEILRFFREYEEEQYRRGVRIERVDRREPIPASYAQQRLWLVEQTATDLSVYNMYFATELRGDLDEAALRGAAGDLVRRHEILRTALTETPQGLLQTIDDDCAAVFGTHRADTPEEHDRLLLDVVSTRFDLAKAPLIRFDLLRTAERRWTFVVTQHHVVSDGWSTGLIKKELSELYAARVAGRSPRLPELTVQYADYAVWEREWLGSDLAQRQRAYWRDRLAELPPLLDLVPSRQRQAVQSYRGSAVTFRYPPAFLDRARGLCGETGTTLYSTFMAAYSLLLSRMTRQSDIAVGSPLANRPYPALERTLGLFFNTITVRTRVDESSTVRDYLAQARSGAFDAFAHQDLPFDQVVQATAPERSSSHSPIFQTIFILQTYPGERFTLPGVHAEAAPTPFYSAQYDLMFKLREDSRDGGLQGLLIYNDTLFDEADARRFADCFVHLVERMCEAPDARLADLPLIDPDSSRLIDRWNAATSRPVPARRVEEEVLGRLREDPERAAVTFRGTVVSRGELARGAESVAAGLRSAGLSPGSRVGVLVPRSPELIAVLLGILRAGLVYVPLDGAAPDGRTTSMLDSADCVALVAGEVYEGRCPSYAGVRLKAADLLRHPGAAGSPRGAADDAAYVIFTSGSTGRPKGVEVSHANVMNLFTALDEVASPPDPAVWLAVTQVTFDIAVVELLWTVARGVPVVLAETSETLRHTGSDPWGLQAPATIPELIRSEGATAMQATPTLLRGVLRLPGAESALGGLRLLMVGGEPLDLTLARQLKDLGIPRVLNMYGPTETTVWSTCWEVPREPDGILVGRPLANTAAHVVDATLGPVPIGMFGELVLAGGGVARGYVGSPALTAERFPTLPSLRADGRVYRTGDIARWLPSGEIELVGRVDNQVKVGGYRIELEEVEQALNSLAGVADSAVTVQREREHALLVAHYVPAPGAVIDEAYLRAGLADLLPDQMVPAAYAACAALPTTSSGKTDRNALPHIPVDTREQTAQEPANDLETRLLAVWRAVLGDDGIGPADDFFRSGGTSILVAQLLTEVRERVHEDARIVDLFRYPSVRAYAAHISGTSPGEDPRRGRAPAADARRAARQRRGQQVSRKKQLRAEAFRPVTD
ncbi:amino acid adenylation domain-containing protein [Streptomyces sp. ME19-01-6]|uniref:non-ribosomal peptide synthetase n=1 Tax=Streptomyces sp. ME19-01-6 TaxID=3028686 RepID=UPI0029AC5C41|nr:amino acid adenylation domain-containing protein [Streptomyces sp. ME19-01-6]MDX3226207.1 amino acid adenylation domain-containing protein [Streptomyces sp. ME19-01-6]